MAQSGHHSRVPQCPLLSEERDITHDGSADKKWSPLPITGHGIADLPVKLRVTVRIHATLKCLRGIRPIKELRRDAQSADLITGKPSGTNLVSLANACHRPGADHLA
jgi:hypothetical protein